MSIRAELLRFFIHILNRLSASSVAIERKRALAASVRGLPPPPDGTRFSPLMIGSVKAKWIIPSDADTDRVILYLHGGGWVYGWVFFYDAFVSGLAVTCRARALAIDYSLAPEHPFPYALNQCLESYRYLIEERVPPEKIVVMGDSAGANMAIALMLMLKKEGLAMPAALVCMSPPIDLASPEDSYRTNRQKDVLLSPSFARLAGRSYCAGHDPHDPLISPMYGDLKSLAPILIQAGGDEMLLSDATRFARRAQEAGVNVSLSVFPRMWHVFQIFYPWLPEARRAVAEIGRFVLHST